MSDLKSTIEELASEFAASILQALRAASIDELTGVSAPPRRAAAGKRSAAPADVAARPSPKRGRGGRLGRRSPADIDRMVDGIVSLLEKHPEGLRAEEIRASLDCQAKELPRPLADALEAGRISKSGQKRATTYFAGTAAGGEGGSTAKRRGRAAKRGKRGS